MMQLAWCQTSREVERRGNAALASLAPIKMNPVLDISVSILICAEQKKELSICTAEFISLRPKVFSFLKPLCHGARPH